MRENENFNTGDLHVFRNFELFCVAVKSGGHEKRFLTIRFFISRHMRTFFSDVIFNSGHS